MKKHGLLWTLILATVVTIYAMEMDEPNYNETANIDQDQHSKLLSRKKRFLIFPDGSSFQLVFCTQTHGYLQIGDIVWFGNTAALAWELPSDPELFNILKKEARPFGDVRRQDNKHIYYLDEDGKVLSKVPYHKRPIVNPAFAKRSIEGETPNKNSDTNLWSVKELHDKERQRNHFQDLQQDRVKFHRYTRTNLYEKLEKVFQGISAGLIPNRSKTPSQEMEIINDKIPADLIANRFKELLQEMETINDEEVLNRVLPFQSKSLLKSVVLLGWNGRECVLRMLCDAAKGSDVQGTFLQEIVKATFTLPRGRGFDSEEYDVAHGSSGECTQAYPGCNISAM